MQIEWLWSPFDALTPAPLYALLRLRQEVFVVEQRCAYLDADGLDPRAHHLLGYSGGELVAVLRAFAPGERCPEAVIGRVVTTPSARGRGLGYVLMEEGQRRVFATWGPCPIHLSAQAHLRHFYERLGYRVDGPGYGEDGIPHLPMTKPA